MSLVKRHLTLLSVVVLLAGIAIPARAADNDSKSAVSYRAGYNEGYRIGYSRGQTDSSEGHSYKPKSDEYKKADIGYLKPLGDKDDYKNGFRSGYMSGYGDGYTGKASALSVTPGYVYPGSPQYGTVYVPYATGVPNATQPYYPAPGAVSNAFVMGQQRGYHDGLSDGVSDYQRSRTFDPARHDEYQSANKGYNPSYGSLQDYAAGYRQGFSEGYGLAFGAPAANRG